MLTTPSRRALAIAVACTAVASAVLAAGCAKHPPAKVIAVWPTATSERVVPQPPEPLRWPLTGLIAPSGSAIRQRVVSVKVENSASARPQTGLQAADVVYETLTEGGVTRFNALFHSQVPGTLGPVRSARLSDLAIVPQYGALFVFSGASTFITGQLARTSIQNLSEDAGVTAIYHRSSDRRMPHNLYVSVPKARREGARRGWAKTQTVRPFKFGESGIDATPTVTRLGITVSPVNRVVWTYDAAKRRYTRQTNGRPHVDMATGKALWARNVVVIWAKTRELPHRDVAGSPTLGITLIGTGQATVFRDGLRFDGKWTATADAPPVFETSEGTRITLAPGNTWMEVVPTSLNITMR
jgi:hypothetical protein